MMLLEVLLKLIDFLKMLIYILPLKLLSAEPKDTPGFGY
jgi:hypothetical protein